MGKLYRTEIGSRQHLEINCSKVLKNIFVIIL